MRIFYKNDMEYGAEYYEISAEELKAKMNACCDDCCVIVLDKIDGNNFYFMYTEFEC